MVNTRRLFGTIVLSALALLSASRASAVTITQSGTLGSDNQIVQLGFSTASTQNFTFFTTSYSGGLNADGTTTAAGGFDPVLSLFNSNGTIYAGNSSTAGGADAFLTDVLGPGSYILVLSEFPNYSSGTIGSFAGIGTIVSDACGTSSAFTDAVTCSQRTGNYSVNVSSSAVTPEPPSALLLLLPLGGVVYLNRRKLAASATL